MTVARFMQDDDGVDRRIETLVPCQLLLEVVFRDCVLGDDRFLHRRSERGVGVEL